MPKGKKARYAYYAVAKGKKGPGVYATWKETEQHTRKVSGAKHQGCDTLDEVREFFEEHKVDLDLVTWGEGTRLPGDAAPFTTAAPQQHHVLAQPASQGVAVAVAVYASSSQSSGLSEAASAAMARAVEVLGRSPSPAEPSPVGADKELPPLPPSSQPLQDIDDAASIRGLSEPPKEKTALLRVRNLAEVALTALCSPNGDGTSAPEVPQAALAETMRDILKEIDDGLRTDPQDGVGPQMTE